MKNNKKIRKVDERLGFMKDVEGKKGMKEERRK